MIISIAIIEPRSSKNCCAPGLLDYAPGLRYLDTPALVVWTTSRDLAMIFLTGCPNLDFKNERESKIPYRKSKSHYIDYVH